MRYGFVTCVELGMACIEEIYELGGHLDLLITLHDEKAKDKSGRIYLDGISERHSVPLFKINHINDADSIEAIRSADLDWLFIIGWSQIANSEVLASTRYGVLGMHPTLLPEGRGRAAVPWAIIKGLDRTGVTMFVLDEGVDTGPLIAQVELPIAGREDAGSLYNRVQGAHRELMRVAWPLLESGNCAPAPQDEAQATEWPGRKPEDGAIHPAMTVGEVDRLVRGVTRPYPGAFWDEDGVRWRVWEGVPGQRPGAPLVLNMADGKYSCTVAEREDVG